MYICMCICKTYDIHICTCNMVTKALYRTVPTFLHTNAHLCLICMHLFLASACMGIIPVFLCIWLILSVLACLTLIYREQDQWIQCDDCSKWRKIPVHVIVASKWTCADNSWDPKRYALFQISSKAFGNNLWSQAVVI